MDRVRTLQHVAILLGESTCVSNDVDLPISKVIHRFFESVHVCIDVCLNKDIKILTLFLGDCFANMDVAQKNNFVNELVNSSDQLKSREVALIILDNSSGTNNNLQHFTNDDHKLKLFVIVNYNGKNDIVRAVKEFSNYEKEAGRPAGISVKLTKDLLEQKLATKELSDLDLLICTEGVKCIGDAFLWQCAYSELYFTDTVWWQWSQEDFVQAIGEFSSRQRRFGQTSEQVEAYSLC